MLNSRLGLFAATRLGSSREGLHLLRAVLLPKLRTHFAEFLSVVYLTRLRILSSPTCVGLRYGWPLNWLRGFSWQRGINRFAGHNTPRHRVSALTEPRICLRLPPTPLNRDVHHPADLAFCVPPSLVTRGDQYRNIDLFTIGYAFRPHLRIRLTLS